MPSRSSTHDKETKQFNHTKPELYSGYRCCLKILIAILSCARDESNGFNQAVRNTWLRDIQGADYYFFLGRGAVAENSDEILLDCPDGYLNLPEKSKALFKWASDNQYDYVFKCDTDTYVNSERLLSSGFYENDYTGYFNGVIGVPNTVYSQCYSWASGGSGYWLSGRAARYISEQDTHPACVCPMTKIPCEDLWVGQVLGPRIATGFFSAKHDPRYGRSYRDDCVVEISAHYCSEGAGRKFNTDWMYRHHGVNQ